MAGHPARGGIGNTMASDGILPGAAYDGSQPFAAFARSVQAQSELRAAVTAAYRRPEAACVGPLLAEAALPPAMAAQAEALARKLVAAIRAKGARSTVDGLIREYDLSSQEGVALMCLAEALLRIPDDATRDALIRDKISTGDWRAHLGHSPSVFVNAATWGLMVSGKLTGVSSEAGLAHALSRLIGRGGEPLIRRGVDMAMRLMGEQFVTGQTIAEALANSRAMEARGFRYSYDMLGEAATTAADAARYFRDYEQAIHAIGKAAAGRGVYDGPGISVKLSALHPRYSRAQQGRVMEELLPRLRTLTLLARQYDIGLNIDAEESDRLEISLDLLEVLCSDPALSGWNGIGFVVQAYQKRAPFVLDVVIDLARRSGHRLMVRLVKGAYWDSEIKRAQVDGLEGFPVFTRKAHTDVSYLACARKLLAAPDAVFPQFATHNAATLAAIHSLAGPDFHPGQYEFQCLHGMGEPLYDEVVGPAKLNRPCRVYAPVGTHETLLAYLVRRLLENGANSSFVNRIHDPAVSVDSLVTDPVQFVAASQPAGAPHSKIPLPRDMFAPVRGNSAGLDLSNEQTLAHLASVLTGSAPVWRAAPDGGEGEAQDIRNPADRRDLVGQVIEASPAQIDHAVAEAVRAAPAWRATPPAERAACLLRAADLFEARMQPLLGLIVREAGKSFPNAIAEVREAVDFLRYYAAAVRDGFINDTHRPLGPIACISPWNFPLAIFVGQVSAALAAGNPVLAKPAEETALIAAQAVAILREAGVPTGAVQLLPGQGEVGARLVADARICGVMFTGSTDVARAIQRTLAQRLSPEGHPIPLIAETGGQNALVVDSSALAEQVVADVLLSAFDSAGQRCSALRVLCLQDAVADRVLTMLRGAMAELAVGNPALLSVDVGPVITDAARDGITAHIQAMRAAGRTVYEAKLGPDCSLGSFVPPTIIEIDSLSELTQEVFGPVLHVLRYQRDGLDALLGAINATGYGLTFGVHSRIDEMVGHVVARADAGNIYVNRNLIGAVVGVQPFGGHGLSGTGPKAGGPLYLRRLLSHRLARTGLPGAPPLAAALAWRDWLAQQGWTAAVADCTSCLEASPVGTDLDLPGPVGERNRYRVEPRGMVLCISQDEAGLLRQVSAALATGNTALVPRTEVAVDCLRTLPSSLATQVRMTTDPRQEPYDLVLFDAAPSALEALCRGLADRPGPIVPVYAVARDSTADEAYPLDAMVRERSVSTNTAAAGGNASLMMLG
jgi:RHH-type transcriptional regulator, proline utilization regulon repressor / proline dehydrogenase / delta 1-pyrroline-5-carboxylate dehydrogenase